MPTVVGVLVEYTLCCTANNFFNRVETHLKQLGYSKWLYVGALLGVWGIIVLVLPSH
ncbi:hypothetical protein HMPREF0308_0001 [Corynebacterium striatum ATCC 6940]|nr:hypothetical protein HMPREF0308_0001 [Corynebacterium striatum ATCC 6940]